MQQGRLPHVWYVCPRGDLCGPYCQYCEGGLALCVMCGGLEGSLLPWCPGERISLRDDERNYRMYQRSAGPFCFLGWRQRPGGGYSRAVDVAREELAL